MRLRRENIKLRDSEMATLFKALGQILYNQDKILKHLGINKYDSDYGYDNSTENVADECYSIERDYKAGY